MPSQQRRMVGRYVCYEIAGIECLCLQMEGKATYHLHAYSSIVLRTGNTKREEKRPSRNLLPTKYPKAYRPPPPHVYPALRNHATPWPPLSLKRPIRQGQTSLWPGLQKSEITDLSSFTSHLSPSTLYLTLYLPSTNPSTLYRHPSAQPVYPVPPSLRPARPPCTSPSPSTLYPPQPVYPVPPQPVYPAPPPARLPRASPRPPLQVPLPARLPWTAGS